MFKNLKVKMLAASFILLCIAIVAAGFLTTPLNKMALALTGNYSKTQSTPCSNPANQLCVSDWNNLDDDFVAKSGDTMTGPLVLPGNPTQNLQAATKQYVDSSSIRDSSGNNLKIVCGNTVPGFTNWQNYSFNPHSVYIDVDTSVANFAAGTTPNYFAYILGSYSYLTTGTAVIYNPTATGFRMYANFLGENNDFLVPPLYGGTFINSSLARSTFQWAVYWCGIGR